MVSVRELVVADSSEQLLPLEPLEPLDPPRFGGGVVVSVRELVVAPVSIRQHTSAYVSIRQNTSENASIRQHTSVYVALYRCDTHPHPHPHPHTHTHTQSIAVHPPVVPRIGLEVLVIE